jgi:hypothetical protein
MSLDPTPSQPSGRALIDGIVAGLAGIATGRLWPGFDPASLPLAVALDAEPATWLINHAGVPGYERADANPTPGKPPLFRRAGLDERLTANSVAMIGDQLTATIFVDEGTSLPHLVALAAHELFHVFQRRHYPDWGANETSLLTYPWDDPANLALANHEVTLLSRAVSAPDDQSGGHLAAQALATRQHRFRLLTPEARDYENAVELVEGTARYIESRVASQLGTSLPQLDTRDGIDLRRRCYRTGHDWCVMLDRLAGPDWRAAPSAGPGEPMPVLTDVLAAVVGQPDDLVDDGGWRDGLAGATATIDSETARRAGRLELVRASAGASILLQGQPGAPLRVAGFDPMNLTPLPDGRVLHERFLDLTLGETRFTVLDRASVTTAAGPHPLFSGVDRAEILIAGSTLPSGTVWDTASLTELGVRVDGPFTVRQAGLDMIEILAGRPPSSIRS